MKASEVMSEVNLMVHGRRANRSGVRGCFKVGVPRGWRFNRSLFSSATVCRLELSHRRFRLLQPELHVHLAVHRRRGSDVLLSAVPLAGSPV
jgi:hypothetical protein